MPSEQAIFDELKNLCKSKGYIHAIVYFCFRDSYIRYSPGGLTTENLENLYSPERLLRTEITTLIGLMMRGTIDFSVPEPEIIQNYIDESERLLEDLHKAMFSPLGGQDLINQFQSEEFIRESIFYGAESAYPFQFRDFAVLKYENDSDWLLKNKKIKLEISLDIFKGIEKAFSVRGERLRSRIRNTPIEEIKYDMLSVSTFTCREIAEIIGHSYNDIKAFIDAFTIPEKERNSSFNSLKDFNVAYAYPIIRKGPDEYIMLQYFGLAEAFYDSPFYWMCKDREYYPIASQNRGGFTEVFSYQRLSSVFGNNTYRNVELVDSKNNVLGEIDVLVIFGDHAIVLQAKSKRLTLESRKGNDKSLRDDFKAAVQHAVDQAFSCAELLINPSVRLRVGSRIISLDDRPRIIFPMTVVSDHYPSLSIQAYHFLQVNPTETIIAPLVTDIFTIDMFAEFLNSPLRFLNYLKLRSRLHGMVFMNHEITAFSYHLSNNLWIQDDFNGVYFSDDLNAPIDVAMLVRREGIEGNDTPEGILTLFAGTPFDKLISTIENKPIPVAIRLGMFLLELGGETVKTINDHIIRITNSANRDGQSHDATLAFPEQSSGLTIHCNKLPDNKAEELLDTHCTVRKYLCKADGWFGILLFPDESVRLITESNSPWKYNEDMENLIPQVVPPELRDM